MYTLHMSWSFRATVLTIVMAWGLAPQIACFMPEQMLTQPERDCCKEMSSDCGGANMSHACCRTVVRTDVGITAKTVRIVTPHFDVAERMIDAASSIFLTPSRELSAGNGHAPPHDPGVSSLVLRI